MRATITLAIDEPRAVSVCLTVEAPPAGIVKAMAQAFPRAIEALQSAVENGHGEPAPGA